MLRIVAIGIDKSGCGWYRIRQPLNALAKAELADTYVTGDGEDLSKAEKLIEIADIVIVRPNAAMLVRALKKMDFKGKIVCDIDDNLDVVQPSNDLYKNFGEEEYTETLPDGRKIPLFVQGVEGFDKFKNMYANVDRKYVLETVDAIQTTTEKLANYLRKYNNNVYVIPNVIDFDALPDARVMPDLTTTKVMWSGGSSHGFDFVEVGNQIANMQKRYNIDYYSLGMFFKGHFKGYNPDRTHVYPWVEFQAHLLRIKLLNPDIAIAPLEDVVFNEYKSAIRFCEYGALGIPIIAKNMSPYKEVISDGVNGFLYNNSKDFGSKLELLIKDSELRRKIGASARNTVINNYSLSEWIPKIAKIYQTICNKS